MTAGKDAGALQLVCDAEAAGQRQARVLARLLDLPASWNTAPDGTLRPGTGTTGTLRDALNLGAPCSLRTAEELLGDIGPAVAALVDDTKWLLKGDAEGTPRVTTDGEAVSLLRSLESVINDSALPENLRDGLAAAALSEHAQALAACQTPQTRAAVVKQAAREVALSRSGTALTALATRLRRVKATGPVRELVTGDRQQPWPDAQWQASMLAALAESEPTALEVLREIDASALTAEAGDPVAGVTAAWRASVAGDLPALIEEMAAWQGAFEADTGWAVIIMTWTDAALIPGIREAWMTPEARGDDWELAYRKGTLLQVPWVIARQLAGRTAARKLASVAIDQQLAPEQFSTLLRLFLDEEEPLTTEVLGEKVAVACALEPDGAKRVQQPAGARRVVPAKRAASTPAAVAVHDHGGSHGR